MLKKLRGEPMKNIYLNLLIASGIVLISGNVLAADTAYPVNNQADNLIIADASLDLDITMEVIDEESDSPADIIHVIELPVRGMRQEPERRQNKAFSGSPDASDGSGVRQREEMHEYRERIENRPTARELDDLKGEAREQKQNNMQTGR